MLYYETTASALSGALVYPVMDQRGKDQEGQDYTSGMYGHGRPVQSYKMGKF